MIIQSDKTRATTYPDIWLRSKILVSAIFRIIKKKIDFTVYYRKEENNS